MAFVVIAHYRARPGQEDRVRTALEHMINPSRAEPGNLLYEVGADPRDSAVFSIYEKYVNEDAFTAHLAAPHFTRWLKEEVLPNLATRVRHDLIALEPEPEPESLETAEPVRAVSTASVRTDRPERYGRQLVSHLSRRSGGEWSDDQATGWIALGDDGRAELSRGDGVLHIRIETVPDRQARLEDVVERHLVRFGTRDELVVQWTRDDEGQDTGPGPAPA